MVSDSEASGRLGQTIWLATGYHMSPEEGLNIMECAAYVCGLEHSSYPVSACPVISEVAREVADRASPEQRQTLTQFILPIANSVASDGVTLKRLFYCVDFVVRQLAPAALTYFGMLKEARLLQFLPDINDICSAEDARQTLRGLFLTAYLNPSTLTVSHTLCQLESTAGTAAKVLSSDCDALTVLLQLKAAMVRFERQADGPLANLLFVQKRVLLENLLSIGPNRAVQSDILKLRRQRFAQLQAKMASGEYGRSPGSEDER